MHELPHHYEVSAEATSEGDVLLRGAGLPDLSSQAPSQFGGPGDRWSPESLLIAAIADCFTLSFRAIANASKFPFVQREGAANGVLDMVERKMLFTEVQLTANLTIPGGADIEKAERLLSKAEQTCLITNSLSMECHLVCNVKNE